MKYNESLKQKVISYYNSLGNKYGNLAKTCRHFNIKNHNMVKGWINPIYKEKQKQWHSNWFKNNYTNLEFKKKHNEQTVNKIKERYKNDPEFKKKCKEQACINHKKRYKNDSEFRNKINKTFSIRHKERMKTDIKYKEKWKCMLKKYRALKLLILENYTKEDEQYTRNLFDNKCVICGSIHNLAIDHWFPLNLWYPLTRTNAVLLCKKCNSSKCGKLPFEKFSEHFELIMNKLGIIEFPKPSLGPIAWLLFTIDF